MERDAQFGAPAACTQCGAPFSPAVVGQISCDRCQGLLNPEPRAVEQAEVAGFRLLHELGAGRFSRSWLGEDARSHAVVVKLLRRYAPDVDSVRLFLEEAERLAVDPGLDHPALARPLCAGVHLVEAFFLVYQGGGELTLADELRQRGRVLPARALELCAQVCEGLAALHRAGVLHLDLKPANVGLMRLTDGEEQAVVLDGITSHLLGHVGLRDGEPVPLSSAAGTSPEQVEGREPDPRSDLYSVGVLLFQLISGRLPVAGSTTEDLLRAHREHRVLRLRDVGRRVHPELEDLLSRLMAQDPARRPASGEEAALMMRALAALAEAAPVEDALEADDPIAVPAQRPARVSAPPQMMPGVDPALERAMMGVVPAPAPERAPGIAARVPRGPPRWWPAAVGAALVLGLAGSLIARKPRPAPGARATAAATAPSPPLAATTITEALANAPRPPPATPEAEPARPSKLAQYAASPWAKNFDRAQKALWTNRPDGAKTILRDILRKPNLSRRDRARATRMMGEAEAKKGNRAKAAQWWRQSFQLYDDPEERARVARLLQGGKELSAR